MKVGPGRVVMAMVLLMPIVAFGQGSMLRIVCADEDVGAEVKINGKFRGECPVDIQVAPERMTISVEKGSRKFVQEIRMGENSVKKIEVVMSRSPEELRVEEQRLANAQKKAEEDAKERECKPLREEEHAHYKKWVATNDELYGIPGDTNEWTRVNRRMELEARPMILARKALKALKCPGWEK